MKIDIELLEVYRGLPFYCRQDLEVVTPGWGYTGPFEQIGYSSYIMQSDLMNPDNWRYYDKDINSFWLHHIGWIPSNLIGLKELIDGIINIHQKVGADYEEGGFGVLVKLLGWEFSSIRNGLAGYLEIYSKVWKMDYELSIPSVSDLSGDIELSYSEQGEPTIEVYHSMDCFQFGASDLTRYAGIYTDPKACERTYITKISLLEGDFHVVYVPPIILGVVE